MKPATSLPKFGLIGFSICLIELVGIWVPFSMLLRAPNASAPWLLRSFGVLYLAGLLSLPVSIVGLFKDNPRTPALIALVFGIVNIYVCGVPLIG